MKLGIAPTTGRSIESRAGNGVPHPGDV